MMVETIRPTISERDIVTNLAKHGTNPLDMPVASMMTQTVKTCSPQEPIGGLIVKFNL